jgi:hypothetical protein
VTRPAEPSHLPPDDWLADAGRFMCDDIDWIYSESERPPAPTERKATPDTSGVAADCIRLLRTRWVRLAPN